MFTKIQFRFFIATMLFVQLAYSNNKEVQVPELTTHAKISLLTVGSADAEIWQNFGHTAIRIKDSILGWDLVYNYGTFDFSEPGFIEKFIKRSLLYYESIDNFNSFEEMYREENRSIHDTFPQKN